MNDPSAPVLPVRVQAALGVLRARGERVTRVRQAVIEVLDGTAEHLHADEIVGRAAAAAPGVHRASVYRALATLGELGLVSHTHIGGSATVYHLTVDVPDPAVELPAHAHLQCSSCHRVIDIPVDVLNPLAARVQADLGFRLEPQHTALLGICADCR
jgi:Fur family transcriptional regulator, ferric uptake regulator